MGSCRLRSTHTIIESHYDHHRWEAAGCEAPQRVDVSLRHRSFRHKVCDFGGDLRLGEEYMNNIEVQRRKQHPERVGAPGELGNKDISPGSSDMNTVEAQTRWHKSERLGAPGDKNRKAVLIWYCAVHLRRLLLSLE